MLISINWIKDFVDIPEQDYVKLAERFTLSCAEVEHVKIEGEFWKKLKVVEIISVKKHPEADKIRLVTFKEGVSADGTDMLSEVVCGAMNVREGLKAVFAPVGTTLPIGITLEPKTIRGFLSKGMLCSEAELAMTDHSDGIIELPSDAPVGKTLQEYWKKDVNVIIDIDNKSLTHRPDLWGQWGLAREFSAIFNSPLKDRFSKSWEQTIASNFTTQTPPIIPQVEPECACLGYMGLSIDNVTVSPSPQWMINRLLSVGLRPINNIVDISNYVMMELGIPLHIFDRDLIEGQTLRIHSLKKNEKFVTLDEQERDLIAGDLVISDSVKPLVLAGIMGGLSSGVSEKTKRIFIEVANWQYAVVRRTSTRLGLRTDSLTRYEKSLDSTLLNRTLYRTLELVKELCPNALVIGQPTQAQMIYPKPLVIPTSYEKIEKVLGISLGKERILNIFKSLDFKVQESSVGWNVEVPSYRATKDIEVESDLIEEIGRVVGYDNIPPQSPQLDIAPVQRSNLGLLHERIRNFMVYQTKSLEVMTYPLIGKKLLELCRWELPKGHELTLANAMSADTELMRPSLVPSILQSVALNCKNFDEFKMFELGRAYLPDEKNFSQDRFHFVMAFYKETSPFLDVINATESLFNACHIPARITNSIRNIQCPVVSDTWEGCHPYEYQTIQIMGQTVGAVLSIHPLLLRKLKIKNSLSLAIVDITMLENKPLKKNVVYKPISRNPSSTFDWTVIISKSEKVGNVLEVLKKVKLSELEDIKVLYRFDLSPSSDALTLRAFFNDPDKTLSSEFLENTQRMLINSCQQAGFPLKS